MLKKSLKLALGISLSILLGVLPVFAMGDDVEIDVGISGGFIPGDIDNNGSFDLNDISALAKYVAGWETSVNVAALDPNGDSKVDLKDVNHLARVKAGWNNVTISNKEYKPNN